MSGPASASKFSPRAARAVIQRDWSSARSNSNRCSVFSVRIVLSTALFEITSKVPNGVRDTARARTRTVCPLRALRVSPIWVSSTCRNNSGPEVVKVRPSLSPSTQLAKLKGPWMRAYTRQHPTSRAGWSDPFPSPIRNPQSRKR